MIKKYVKFLYHGNIKVAIVVHRDNGTYQALESHIPDINHAIELTTPSTSTNKNHYYYAVTSRKLFPKMNMLYFHYVQCLIWMRIML